MGGLIILLLLVLAIVGLVVRDMKGAKKLSSGSGALDGPEGSGLKGTMPGLEATRAAAAADAAAKAEATAKAAAAVEAAAKAMATAKAAAAVKAVASAKAATAQEASLPHQSSLDEDYAARNGMWVCPYCETINEDETTACQACGIRR